MSEQFLQTGALDLKHQPSNGATVRVRHQRPWNSLRDLRKGEYLVHRTQSQYIEYSQNKKRTRRAQVNGSTRQHFTHFFPPAPVTVHGSALASSRTGDFFDAMRASSMATRNRLLSQVEIFNNNLTNLRDGADGNHPCDGKENSLQGDCRTEKSFSSRATSGHWQRSKGTRINIGDDFKTTLLSRKSPGVRRTRCAVAHLRTFKIGPSNTTLRPRIDFQ